MSDDRWRDSYDAWKLASPYDYYDEADVCHCEDYEVDTFEGRAMCGRCGNNWLLTAEELDAHEHAQAKIDAEYARDMRRERWLQRWRWVRSFFVRAPKIDDDIPF